MMLRAYKAGKFETTSNGDGSHSTPSSDEPDTHDRTVTEASNTVSNTHFSSGLSALIQAATSQLGQLADAAALRKPDGDEVPYSGINSADMEGDEMDRGKHGIKNSIETPSIVPKPDPNKHNFPELLMTLAVDSENKDVIAFLPDGKFFALRPRRFVDEIMVHYFAVTTFEEFLDLANDWGFTRVLQQHTPPTQEGLSTALNIEVFRHPQFIQGEWDKVARIKFGQSPHDARIHALPARVDFSIASDGPNADASSKRRLSPGFLARRDSETSTCSQRLRVNVDGAEGVAPPSAQDLLDADDKAGSAMADQSRKNSIDESAVSVDNSVDPCQINASSSYSHVSHADEIRSQALAITAEKLQLRHGNRSRSHSTSDDQDDEPLVESAVESTTHTIVTDAIESLLRDERHTKETYLKHEKELSTSTLPGIVPISKQLFSPKQTDSARDEKQDAKYAPPQEVTTAVAVSQAASRETSSLETSPVLSPKAVSTHDSSPVTTPTPPAPSSSNAPVHAT